VASEVEVSPRNDKPGLGTPIAGRIDWSPWVGSSRSFQTNELTTLGSMNGMKNASRYTIPARPPTRMRRLAAVRASKNGIGMRRM